MNTRKIRWRYFVIGLSIILVAWTGFRLLFADRSATTEQLPVFEISEVPHPDSLPATVALQSTEEALQPSSMPDSERKRLSAAGILTNADRPIDILSRDPSVIMLRNAIIDTDIIRGGGPGPMIPEEFRASGDYRRAIIVFDEPISGKHWDFIADRELRVEHFVPNRALAVSGDHQAITRLRNAPGVRHVEPFHPFFKMNSDVQAYLTGTPDAETAATRAGSGRYHVLLFGDPETAVAAAIDHDASGDLPSLDVPAVVPRRGALGIAGARMRELPALPRQAVAEVDMDSDNLYALLHSDAVKWVEPVPRFEPMNDLGIVTTRRNLVRKTLPSLDGSGQIIGVSDTGADVSHPALAGRLVPQGYVAPPGGTPGHDYEGHGTHVVGTILGSGALSDTVNSAPGSAGPPYAAYQFSGMATNAQYVMIEDYNAFQPYEIAMEAYQRGARIANNSWGASDNFEYGIASMQWDSLVRDVDMSTEDKKAYTVFFAAGNSGAGTTAGTSGSPGTISQPGNAKNVITIGAIEQQRDADNLTQSPYRSLQATDSDWQVASYSGRGPIHGRVKPDLVAPGEYVLSLQSSDINTEIIDSPLGEIRDFNHGNVDSGSKYAFMSGTSRATAFASGAAALLRQHYIGLYGAAPSPAMIKALLVSGAHNLHGSAYEWGPKRDSSALAIENITHAGEIVPHNDVFGWWSFENDFLNDEELISVNGTNVFIPGYILEGVVEFENENANPGFEQFVRFKGGSVHFEMTENAITNGWRQDTEFQARTIEFWIKVQGMAMDTYPILDFVTENEVDLRILLKPGNAIGVFGMENAKIYVNGTAQVHYLGDGWNHVAVVSPIGIQTAEWTLGGLTADIDELRFYNTELSASEIKQNYDIGLGYVISAHPDLTEQLDGLRREDVIHDGWGKLDIAGAVLGAGTFADNKLTVFDEHQVAPITTGADWQHFYNVPHGEGGGSLKITLTWSDVPGSPGSARNLVNDLDLRVYHQPGTAQQTVYAGNFLGRDTWGMASYPIVIKDNHEFGPAHTVTAGRFAAVEPVVLSDARQLRFLHDRENNVEQIIIRDLKPGNYRIVVQGAQVPVEGAEGGQVFALVINRGVSSAGEPMGRDPELTLDRDNTPVMAYTAAGNPRSQIGVRRWVDSETYGWPKWRRLENKWFHYGDGPYREIVSRNELGSAHSPTLAFDEDNTLYLAWIQENENPGIPDSVYLLYLTADWQDNTLWDGVSRWIQLGKSYQGHGVSGAVFPENVVSPTVRVALDNQPVVSYRQGDRVLVKTWDANAVNWVGLDGCVTGLVATAAAEAPVKMAVDSTGYPVLLWTDATAHRLRVKRWSGTEWQPVAGGLIGDSTARDAALACDDFGAIAVSWIAEKNGTNTVRAALKTGGGAYWQGLGTSGQNNSMVYPGLCGALHADIDKTRIAFTPAGNLMVAWLAKEANSGSRLLLKKWDGAQWDGLEGSGELPGIYNTIGSLSQACLVSDKDGYPLVALRGERTGREEIQVLQSQALDTVDPNPLDPVQPPTLSVDLRYLGASTGTVVIHAFDNEDLDGDPDAVYSALVTNFPAQLTLSQSDQGDLGEGDYWFFAFIDGNANGTWNDGEPAGMAYDQPINVQWGTEIPLTIVLSDDAAPPFATTTVVFDLRYTGTKTGTVVIHAYDNQNMDGEPGAVFNAAVTDFPAEIALSQPAAGFLEEGDTWFFAFIDGNANGTWNNGEAAGKAYGQPVDVRQGAVGPVAIGLTDTTPGFSRFGWGAVEGLHAYSVVIWYKSDHGFPEVLNRNIRAPRHYVHVQDFLLAGYGFEGMLAGRYDWNVKHPDTGVTLFSGWFNVEYPETMAPPEIVWPDGDVLRYARNPFQWTMDPHTAAIRLQIADDAKFEQLVVNHYGPAPPSDDDGIVRFKLPYYAGDGNLSDGSYYWRIITSNRRNSVSSDAALLHIDLQDDQDGPFSISGEIEYFGNITNAVFVVQAFESPGFGGWPVAQVIVSNTMPDALPPFTLRGLRSGTYYVRAFLDLNNNRRPDNAEPHGFVQHPDYPDYPRALWVPDSLAGKFVIIEYDRYAAGADGIPLIFKLELGLDIAEQLLADYIRVQRGNDGQTVIPWEKASGASEYFTVGPAPAVRINLDGYDWSYILQRSHNLIDWHDAQGEIMIDKNLNEFRLLPEPPDPAQDDREFYRLLLKGVIPE